MVSTMTQYLPESVGQALQNISALYGGTVDEIRMYRYGKIVFVIAGRNVVTPIICTEEIMQETIGKLCGHSLYAHEETIRDGYIFTAEGVRVGVTGRAVVCNDRVERVVELASLCIRIPRRIPGAADDIYPSVIKDGIPRCTLIFSPPGVGKTTALRELAALLVESETPIRTALIDTRYELGYGLSGELLDVFKGYPRAAGMEIAIRTMNPQIVVCDEIANEADARAVLKCAASGVAVVASAHGGSVEDLHRQPPIHSLLVSGIFQVLVGLYRKNGRVVHTIYENGGGMDDSTNGGGLSSVDRRRCRGDPIEDR